MSAEPAPPVRAPIIAPTEDVWRAMSPAERERFLVRVLDSLSDPIAAAELADANARADEAATRADSAAARADSAMTALRATLLALFDARGLPCPEDVHARVIACEDPATLQRWILRAGAATSAADALSAP